MGCGVTAQIRQREACLSLCTTLYCHDPTPRNPTRHHIEAWRTPREPPVLTVPIHREPPNQVLWLRTILNKWDLALCARSASIVINYSELNDESSESHPLFSRSWDNHNSSFFNSASSLLSLKWCLPSNRFCMYFAKKRSDWTRLSLVRIGKVEVMLPV